MIYLKIIPNIFEKTGRQTLAVKYRKGITLSECIPEELKKYKLDVTSKGKLIPRAEWDNHKPKDAATYTIVCNVEGAVIVAAIAGAAWVSANATLAAVIAAIINIIISFAISELLSLLTTLSHSKKSGGFRSGNTYGWDGINTSYINGDAIPIVYGLHQTGGQCIARYVESDGQNQFLHLLLALSEGPIDSLDEDNILIEGNKIRNYLGSGGANYKPGDSIDTNQSMSWETRMGTDDQPPIINFRNLVVPSNLSVETDANGFIYNSSLNDMTAFNVNFMFPQGLYTMDNQGNVSSRSVTYQVFWRVSGTQNWNTSGGTTFTGRSMSALYTTFNQQGLAPGAYDIMVQRISSAEDPVGSESGLWINGIDEIRYADLSYPGVALLSIRALATKQLNNSFPNIECTLQGKQVAVWDGVEWLLPQFSRNPAWILWDLMTNPDYGLGAFIKPENLDLDSFYALAQYADELVPDGKGGMEPRFQCDIVLDGQTKAWDVVMQILTGCLATIGEGGGVYHIIMEAPATPVQFFGMGDVENFSGFFTTDDNMYNAFWVEFCDADNNYNMSKMPITEDGVPAGELIYNDVSLIGVTRSSQVQRVGRVMLNLMLNCTQYIQFDVGIDALALQAGDCFYFAHDVPQWGFSGRVTRAASATDLEMDVILPAMEPGMSYSIKIRDLTDDTIADAGVLNLMPYAGNTQASGAAMTAGGIDAESDIDAVSDIDSVPAGQPAPAASGSDANIDSIPNIDQVADIDTPNAGVGEGCTRIILATSLPFTPECGDLISFGLVNETAKIFRCLDITTGKDFGKRTITAIEYNESCYDPYTPAVPTPDISELPDFLGVPAECSNIILSDGVVQELDGTIMGCIDVFFTVPQDPCFGTADIFYSLDNGQTWDIAGKSDVGYFRIAPLASGQTVYVAVVSENLRNGKLAIFADAPQAYIYVRGDKIPPPDVQGFTVAASGLTVKLDWQPVSAAWVKGYEIREGVDWASAEPIQIVFSGSHYEFQTAVSGEQTYLIKAISRSGIYSVNTASAKVNVVLNVNGLTIYTCDGTKASGGAGNGMTQFPDIGQIGLNPVNPIDTTISGSGDFDAPTIASGTWQTGDMDLGGIYNVQVSVEPVSINLGITFQVRYKNNASDAYGAWEALDTTNKTCRYFQLLLTATSANVNIPAQITRLFITAVEPDFTKFSGTGVAVPVGGVKISYPQPFVANPILNVLAMSDAGFRLALVSNQDNFGFNVKVVDNADNDMGGNINWWAEGIPSGVSGIDAAPNIDNLGNVDNAT